jgi:hypothetical protein
MITVRIFYNPDGIRAEYTPGNANFSSWMFRKFGDWRQIEEGRLDLYRDGLTPDDALYIEQLAKAQKESGDAVELIIKGKPEPAPPPQAGNDLADPSLLLGGDLGIFG